MAHSGHCCGLCLANGCWTQRLKSEDEAGGVLVKLYAAAVAVSREQWLVFFITEKCSCTHRSEIGSRVARMSMSKGEKPP